MLVEVEDILRQANKAEIEFAKSESPLKKQEKIHNHIFKSARKVTGADIQTFEQLSKFVLDNPTKEADITKIIEESGYLTIWSIDIEKNPWYYNPKLLIEHYEHPRQIIDAALFFATTEKETRNRFEKTLEALEFGYMFYHQRYFAVQIELYVKLIELSLERELTALKVLKG